MLIIIIKIKKEKGERVLPFNNYPLKALFPYLHASLNKKITAVTPRPAIMIVGSQLERVVQKFPTKSVNQLVKASGIVKAQDISFPNTEIKMSCMKFPSSDLENLNLYFAQSLLWKVSRKAINHNNFFFSFFRNIINRFFKFNTWHSKNFLILIFLIFILIFIFYLLSTGRKIFINKNFAIINRGLNTTPIKADCHGSKFSSQISQPGQRNHNTKKITINWNLFLIRTIAQKLFL